MWQWPQVQALLRRRRADSSLTNTPCKNGTDMPPAPDEHDFPLSANGPAYTSEQQRHGVPLSYVGGKLGTAIKELHRYALHHPHELDALQAPMYYLLVAHLGLHNMLGKANDHSLTKRLLGSSADELQVWLRLIEREGDVNGLAGLGPGDADAEERRQNG